MIEIALTEEEWAIARFIGRRRHGEALRHGWPDKHGCVSGLEGHVLGAAGEMVCAKALGRYWEPRVNTFKAADLGRRLQVRTRSRHDYDLIIRKDDNDDDAFALVTHEVGGFCLWGWTFARDGKFPGFLQTHGGREEAYFVPQSALRPVRARDALV